VEQALCAHTRRTHAALRLPSAGEPLGGDVTGCGSWQQHWVTGAAATWRENTFCYPCKLSHNGPLRCVSAIACQKASQKMARFTFTGDCASREERTAAPSRQFSQRH
jgi:hypothetical protein